MESSGRERDYKGAQDFVRDEGKVHYLDCDYDFTGIHMHQNSSVCAVPICVLH